MVGQSWGQSYTLTPPPLCLSRRLLTQPEVGPLRLRRWLINKSVAAELKMSGGKASGSKQHRTRLPTKRCAACASPYAQGGTRLFAMAARHGAAPHSILPHLSDDDYLCSFAPGLLFSSGGPPVQIKNIAFVSLFMSICNSTLPRKRIYIYYIYVSDLCRSFSIHVRVHI
jgi:hypothetical protein